MTVRMMGEVCLWRQTHTPQGRILRVRWRLTPRQLTVIDTFASSAPAPPAIVDVPRSTRLRRDGEPEWYPPPRLSIADGQ